MRATETHFDWLADFIAQLVWVVEAAGRLTYGNLGRQTWEQAVTSGESYAVERRVRFTPDSEYVRQLEWGKRIQENSGRSGKWVIIATDADGRR